MMVFFPCLALSQEASTPPAPLDDQALREIMRSILTPPPEIAKKRISYESTSFTRRLFHTDAINQNGERLKTTSYLKADGRYTRDETLFPLPPPFIRIRHPNESWLLSCTGKWAVKNESFYPLKTLPDEAQEMLSYIGDIKEHPGSKYKLVRETGEDWTIDEIPAPEFVEKLAAFIPLFAKNNPLAPNIVTDPRLALIRRTISKAWRLLTQQQVYSEGGNLWLEKSTSDLHEVTPDDRLFELPEGCVVLGNADKHFQEMLRLEKKFKQEQTKKN